MIYEFKCQCGKQFEKIVNIGTKTTKCDCGKIAKKIFTLPSISFKGSDFTRNDKREKDTVNYCTTEINKMKKEILGQKII